MVGLQVLVLTIGVRIPVPEQGPLQAHTYWVEYDSIEQHIRR